MGDLYISRSKAATDFERIVGGNADAALLLSTPGEGESSCDRNFVLAKNSHNHFSLVPAGSFAGSLSDPKSFPDAIAAESSDVERIP